MDKNIKTYPQAAGQVTAETSCTVRESTEFFRRTKMAVIPPEYAVEAAVRYFFYNRMCGLTPTLTLKTEEDGNLSIDVGVTCPTIPHQPQFAPRRKRSGQGARRRKKEQRACNANERTSNIVKSETILPEPSMTAEAAVNVDADIDVSVTERPLLSRPEQSSEFLHVPYTYDTSSSNGVMTSDLIDFTTCLPNAPISNEQSSQLEETELIVEQKNSILSTSDAEHPSSTNSKKACSSSPHVELMMYAMVKELYRRTCT